MTTTQNLPALRSTRAVTVYKPTQTTNVQVTQPLRLSTALFTVTGLGPLLVALSLHAGRTGQAQILGGVTLLMLFAAFVERGRERRS